MLLKFSTLLYGSLIFHIVGVKTQYKSDLSCYYLKDCRLFCPRDDHPKLNKKGFKATLEGSNNNIENMASGSGVNGFYRPRSALARALYEKQHNDRYLQELDQNEVSCMFSLNKIYI